jgi:hypothetical protein
MRDWGTRRVVDLVPNGLFAKVAEVVAILRALATPDANIVMDKVSAY